MRRRFWLAVARVSAKRADMYLGPMRLAGAYMTAEIDANPEEQAALRRSLEQANAGEGRWITGPESVTSTMGHGTVTWTTNT